MDPNNQQPQGNLTGINKLEEDLQKMTENSQTSTQVPPVAVTPPIQPLTQEQPSQNLPLQNPLPEPSSSTTVVSSEPVNGAGTPPEQGTKKSNLVLTVAMGLMALAVVVAIAYVVGSKMKSSKKTQEVIPSPVATVAPTSEPVVEPTSSTSSAVPSSDPLSITDKTIDIKSFAFNPGTLTVKAGETVMVTNSDTVSHSVTEDSGLFDTGLLAAGQTKTFEAPSKAGVYKYHCSAHLNMTATLTVE